MTGSVDPHAAAPPELRVDPLTGLPVFVAGKRAGRPRQNAASAPHDAATGLAPIDRSVDPFAEGNEAMTPPELWADRPAGAADTTGWRVRSVPNMYPTMTQSFAGDDGAPTAAIAPAGAPESGSGPPADPLGVVNGMPQLLASGPAFGAHEVIVNSARQVQSLGELSLDELQATLAGWAERIAEQRKNPQVACVHLCVNEQSAAGASLPHSHAQLYALSFVPALIARERERSRAYFELTQGRSLAQDLLMEEVRSDQRLIAIDDDAALIAPFASATPYRLTILPRRIEPRFELSEHRGVKMLHTALRALRLQFGGMPPLNLWLRTAPADATSFGWHIELATRLGQPAGFELGTGVNINSVLPEVAAANLRAALADSADVQ